VFTARGQAVWGIPQHHLEAGESKPTWQPTTGTSRAPPLRDAERQ